MNLIDESYNTNRNNKKILLICGIGIAVLLVIIITLLVTVITMNSNNMKLIVDNKKYNYSNYILNKDNVLYIGIEDLTKIINNGYSYKSGNEDVEDNNKCYITNAYESTFFEVDSNEIYKVQEDTNEVEYYYLDNDIIKENNKIYIPLSGIKIAANVSYRVQNKTIIISSIAYIENVYNKPASTSFVPNSSVVWDVTYANKKMLKNNLVITKDNSEKLGLGKISYVNDKKNKKTIVKVTPIIDPKYYEIKYIEKFEQLIVTTENGTGIIQLTEENGNINVKTKIVPQYQSIKPINKDLYLVSDKNNNSSSDSTSGGAIKYGIVNEQGDTVLPIEYDKIGFDISKFNNNNLNSEFIIYDRYIPVKKDGLWGFINLTGKVVIKLEYNDIGCVGTNSSSNVFIIPEIEGIVVKKDGKYGIISNSGKVLLNNSASRIFKEYSNGKEIYTMVKDNNKHNVIDYIKEQAKKDANKNENNKNENKNEGNQNNQSNQNNQNNQNNKTN